MDLNLLVGNWEETGLLVDLNDFDKTRMALKFEILARHMLSIQDQPNYQQNYNQIETLIFPLLRRVCVEMNLEDGTHTFHGGVNPLRVLEEFETWWNRDSNTLRLDLSFYNGIDVEAELLCVYAHLFGPRFRNDNYIDSIKGTIEPEKFIKKHRL